MLDLTNKPMFFCSLCEHLTISSLDYASKLEHDICRQCELKFLQPNREKWEKGWRPNKDQIDNFKKEDRKSVYSILSEINNYI